MDHKTVPFLMATTLILKQSSLWHTTGNILILVVAEVLQAYSWAAQNSYTASLAFERQMAPSVISLVAKISIYVYASYVVKIFQMQICQLMTDASSKSQTTPKLQTSPEIQPNGLLSLKCQTSIEVPARKPTTENVLSEPNLINLSKQQAELSLSSDILNMNQSQMVLQFQRQPKNNDQVGRLK